MLMKLYSDLKHNLTVIQSRAEMNYDLVDEYAAEMKRGTSFDPAEAIYDHDENHYYVYNGAHRIEAMQKADVGLHISFKNGSRADAEWLSFSANTKHGLRRSRADKQRVTKNALLTRPHLSDREIGKHCNVDHKTVGKLRADLVASGEIPQMDERTVTRNGKTFTQAAREEPEYMSKADIEQSIQAWLKDRPPELHLEILADIARKNEDGQRYYGSILKAMPLVYIEANVWTTCLAMLEQMKAAKAEPEYATIPQLEKGVRAWLDGKWYKAPKVHIEVLGDIKNKTVKGPVRLQGLVNDDILPGPRRKRDVIQACNNVLDQIKQRQWQQEREDLISALICINCDEQTIEAIDSNSIHCTTCGDEWTSVVAFEREKDAYQTTRENITPISHAKPCPQCSGKVFYGKSARLDCKKCKKGWPTENEFLADMDRLWRSGSFETQETAEADRDAETQAAPPANQPIFARVPCPKCNEMKIEIKPIEDSVLCHHCKQSWNTMAAFHKERMAPRTASAQPIAEMPTGDQAEAPEEPTPDPDRCDACTARDFYEPEVWVKQYTQHICPQCLQELGAAMIAAASENNEPPKGLSPRTDFSRRLREIAWKVPDEDLKTLQTWIETMEYKYHIS